MTTMQTPAEPIAVPAIDPPTLKTWLDQNAAVVLDVREPVEYQTERLAGSILMPLSTFDPAKLPPITPDKKLVVHCKAGIRGQKAAEMLLRAGYTNVYNLSGGLEAWKNAGLPIIVSPRDFHVMDLQRQAFVVVSLMILTGLALGLWLSPWWLILPLIAGLGLLNAGLTGFCPLLYLIARMPWNRRHTHPSSAQQTSSCCSS